MSHMKEYAVQHIFLDIVWKPYFSVLIWVWVSSSIHDSNCNIANIVTCGRPVDFVENVLMVNLYRYSGIYDTEPYHSCIYVEIYFV